MSEDLVKVKRVCRAETSKGLQCTQYAMKYRDVCRAHGGKSRNAYRAPGFRKGRYVKYIPSGIADKYMEAIGDPQLLDFRQDIALLTARLMELLSTGESTALWAETQKAAMQLKQALADKSA